MVDLLLVVVDSYMRGFKMPDVLEHINGITQGHQEVVQLVQSLLIVNDLLEESWEQRTTPIEEPAPCRLSHIGLPVGNDIDLPGMEV